MDKPTAAEAKQIAKATDRIHAALSTIEPDTRTTYSLTEGCDLSMSTLATSDLYRIIVVHNDFLHTRIKPTYASAYEVRKQLRRDVERAARPFHVSIDRV